MNKSLLFLALGLPIGVAHAQVGIGTTTPSPNAVLDVSSTTKGLMLPRLSDTLSVQNPSAGLMIFDRKMQAPVVHNGTRWNALATLNAGLASGVDSVTYVISGGTNFATGTFKAISVATGITSQITISGGGTGTGIGKPVFGEVAIQKPLDKNSVLFVQAISIGRPAQEIEFSFFRPGTTKPYYSIKLKEAYLSNYAVQSNGAQLSEAISLSSAVVGFKNWVDNNYFTFNIKTGIGTATY